MSTHSEQLSTDLYRLALSRLNEPQAAMAAALQTLASIPATADDLAGANALLRRAPRRRSGRGDPLSRYLDGLDDDEHLLFALAYGLGWSPAQAARALRLGEGPVKSQLRLFRRQFAAFPPETRLTGEAEMRAALVEHWPPPTPEQLTRLQAAFEQAGDEAAGREAAPPAAPPSPSLSAGALPRRLLLISAAAIALVMALAGAALFGVSYLPSLLPPTPQTFSNLPTPITPAPVLAPLWRGSSQEEIRQRLGDSPGLWRTLAMTVQRIDYGPTAYSGPPRRYQAQVWISQPGEGIEAWGLLDGPITQITLSAGDQQFLRNLLNQRSTRRAWQGYTAGLLTQSWLAEMIFPAGGAWMAATGKFVVVQMTGVQARTAMLVDWLDADQVRRYRLWIDTETGILVRLQAYGGDDGGLLLAESTATWWAVDLAAPPPELSALARQASLPPTPAGLEAIPPTPTLAVSPAPRPPLPEDPAPTGFDPRGARLTFQPSSAPAGGPLALAAQINDFTHPPTLPFDIFADGYLLGRVNFGLPWGMRCTRSSDGLRLAFNNASDGSAPGDLRLRWLDLRDVRRVFQPESPLLAESFAFSGDSLHLAAFGSSPSLTSAIYLITVNSAEISRLLPVQAAHSLAFSPDGEFLAFIGRLSGESADALFVVHLRSRTLAFRSDPGAPIDAAINASPILSWNIAYPLAAGDMQSCASPPP